MCVCVCDEYYGGEEETAGLCSAYNVTVEGGVVCCGDTLCDMLTKLVLVHDAATMAFRSFVSM